MLIRSIVNRLAQRPLASAIKSIPARVNTADDIKRALAGKYDIERELGAGWPTVYLVNDVKRQRRVTFKVLHPELAAIVGSERFIAERRLTASLQHPHIMPCSIREVWAGAALRNAID